LGGNKETGKEHMAKKNPHGRQAKAVAYCTQPYHVGDLTLEMLYENGCIENQCRRLAILNRRLRERVKKFRIGKATRYELYGHN